MEFCSGTPQISDSKTSEHTETSSTENISKLSKMILHTHIFITLTRNKYIFILFRWRYLMIYWFLISSKDKMSDRFRVIQFLPTLHICIFFVTSVYICYFLMYFSNSKNWFRKLNCSAHPGRQAKSFRYHCIRWSKAALNIDSNLSCYSYFKLFFAIVNKPIHILSGQRVMLNFILNSLGPIRANSRE